MDNIHSLEARRNKRVNEKFKPLSGLPQNVVFIFSPETLRALQSHTQETKESSTTVIAESLNTQLHLDVPLHDDDLNITFLPPKAKKPTDATLRMNTETMPIRSLMVALEEKAKEDSITRVQVMMAALQISLGVREPEQSEVSNITPVSFFRKPD